jgi:hypothetical protein
MKNSWRHKNDWAYLLGNQITLLKKMLATIQRTSSQSHSTQASGGRFELPPDDHSHNSSDEEDDNEPSFLWKRSNTPAQVRAQRRQPNRKPYFVYLMACTIPSKRVRRMFTHIGKSREPIRKVLRHNEGRVNSHKRSTRSNAPHWRLEMWDGPFMSRTQARVVQKKWSLNTKGINPRIERGMKIARQHNVCCYTPRASLDGKLKSVLAPTVSITESATTHDDEL